jgi:hypothetical protein
MITLRVDEKALRLVVTLAMHTSDVSDTEAAAITHVANQASKGVVDKIEQHLEIDIPDIYGVPI